MKIGVFVIIFLVVIAASVMFIQKVGNQKECNSDSDCSPVCGCHPSSCVLNEQASNCSRVMCTDECVPNTLDCQQGSCACQSGKCTAKITG